MTYREKLEKYKKKLLSEKEMEEVKDEIEKIDAINDYLADCLEEKLDFMEEASASPEEELLEGKRELLENRAVDFEKYVKKSIRRVYAKIAMVTGGILLAILLFIQFGLSPLMAFLYYNPTEQIEEASKDGNSAVIYNKMNIDYSIYSELTMPCKNKVSVQAFSQGYGNYAVTIDPYVTYGTEWGQGAVGQIRRGKLEMYTSNYFDVPSTNYFACYGLNHKLNVDYRTQLQKLSTPQIDGEGQESWTQYWYYSSPQASLEEIKSLDDEKKYIAYVSFERDLDFQEAIEFMDGLALEGITARDGWLAFRNCEESHMPYGVSGHNHEVSLEEAPREYNEKYPYLSMVTGEEERSYEECQSMRKDEEVMTQHILSMCNYMEEQDAFTEMMGSEPFLENRNFQVYGDYVKEHGLKYYGMVCVSTREDMLKMFEKQEVLGIVPKDWK